ncbi:MAG: DUF721 domain-containing protein [Phycisphaerae bacterium]|nr:DUF721 domain-containing protein [Phycisphaerae bacterium]
MNREGLQAEFFRRRQREPRRIELLRAAGLLSAEPEAQRDFWARHNRRYRSRTEPIGRVAQAWLSGGSLRSALKLGPIRAEWERIVPEHVRPHCDVAGLRGGRLIVLVDDPSIRFFLQRELGAALLEALRRSRAGREVRQIVFQIGAMPETREHPRSAGGRDDSCQP